MMAKPPTAEKFFLDGPAGKLEAILELEDENAITGAALVLHPHPQHGGTMHNKVAHTLARSFVRMGYATLRFNFRGTEASEGEYDNGDGEMDDALSAMAWLRSRYPGLPFWLSGFSFGAAMAIKAAVREPVDGLISVAPAVYRFASGLEAQPNSPWLVVQGDEDELVAVDETVEWLDSLEPGPELIVVEGAEHFFHGRLLELREIVTRFVSDRA